METDSRLVVARGWVEGRLGVTTNGYRVSFKGDENLLKLNRGSDGASLVAQQ